jgi:preprotein translocase subunit YajC
MDQYSTLILIALMVVAFYFLIMRPQRKRQQAIAKTLSELTPGTRVMLGSGLFGTVVGVGQKQVVLEISPGTELTVLKQAVSRVVTDDDEDVDVEVDDLADVEPDEVVVSEEPAAADSDTEPPTAGPGSRPTTAG